MKWNRKTEKRKSLRLTRWPKKTNTKEERERAILCQWKIYVFVVVFFLFHLICHHSVSSCFLFFFFVFLRLFRTAQPSQCSKSKLQLTTKKLQNIAHRAKLDSFCGIIASAARESEQQRHRWEAENRHENSFSILSSGLMLSQRREKRKNFNYHCFLPSSPFLSARSFDAQAKANRDGKMRKFFLANIFLLLIKIKSSNNEIVQFSFRQCFAVATINFLSLLLSSNFSLSTATRATSNWHIERVKLINLSKIFPTDRHRLPPSSPTIFSRSLLLYGLFFPFFFQSSNGLKLFLCHTFTTQFFRLSHLWWGGWESSARKAKKFKADKEIEHLINIIASYERERASSRSVWRTWRF